MRNKILFRWLTVGSFFLLPLTTACAGAPAKKEKFDFARDSLAIEIASDKCQSTAGPSASLARAECAGVRKFAWGQEVDKVYEHIRDLALKYGDTVASRTLTDVQKRWPTWRDENMRLCLDWYGLDKGTEGRITAVYCQGDVNRDRAIWILNLLPPAAR